MKYSSFFTKLLKEQNLPSGGNSRVHEDDPSAAMDGFLDQDTNPDEFLTQGIQDTFTAVQSHFNKKMSDFASTLSPEAVNDMPLKDLSKQLGDVFNFVNKINIYSKGKIDQISQDPYAIMAAFLASDITKMEAFKVLHDNLEEFQGAVQDLEGQLSSLKGQIDDFVGDVEDIDAENAASQIQPQRSAPGGSGAPQNDSMTRGNPQAGGSSSLGMSYSESRRHRKHRRPIRG